MAFTPVDRVMRLRLWFMNQGEPCCMQLHVRKTNAAIVVGDLTARISNVKTWWTNYGSWMAVDDMYMYLIEARDLTTEASSFTSEYLSPLLYGRVTGVPCAQNVNAVVHWMTASGGRSYRGRTYVPGIENIAQTGGLLAAGSISSLQGYYAQLMTGLGGAYWKLCVVSYYHDGVKRNPGISTDVTSCQVMPAVASQRRRLPQHH